MLGPGSKTLPKTLNPPSVETGLCFGSSCKVLLGKLEQFFYRLMQKCKKMDMWGVCSKRVQRMRCLCMVWAEMLGGESCSHLFLNCFSSLPRSLPFTPFLSWKDTEMQNHHTRVCLIIAQASVSCLRNCILSWTCLYKLSQLWTNCLLLPDNLSHSTSVLALCRESSFGMKLNWSSLFHSVWQLLNGKFPFPLYFFTPAKLWSRSSGYVS